MGVIYWMFAIAISLRPYPDMYFITSLIFSGTLLGYTKYQEKSNATAIYVTSILHGLLHALAVIALTTFFVWFNARRFDLSGHWYDVWLRAVLLLIEVGILGGLIGSFLFGLNLLVTCACFNMNHNDAFSAMRLDSHRHFLRLRIRDGEVTVYAVGLDKVPSRDQWKGNPNAAPGDTREPAFVPTEPLSPHLIERPIVVQG
jgi:hypothetical protein